MASEEAQAWPISQQKRSSKDGGSDHQRLKDPDSPENANRQFDDNQAAGSLQPEQKE